jgi:DNA-directed RNA polymerase subunit F
VVTQSRSQTQGEEHMTKRETLIAFIKDMLRPRTLKEIIEIEMRDATISKMQAEKSLEYATSVVDYNKQRIRRLQEKLLEIGDEDA